MTHGQVSLWYYLYFSLIWIQSPWVHIISSHWASPFYAVYCHPMLAVNFSAAKCQKKIRKLSIQILILGYLDKGLNQKYYFFTSGLISGQICLIVRMTYMVNIWSFGLEGKIKATIFLSWRFFFCSRKRQYRRYSSHKFQMFDDSNVL